MSSISVRCRKSTQDILSLNLTPYIHLITLMSVRCNASSFSIFSDDVSLLMSTTRPHLDLAIFFYSVSGKCFAPQSVLSELSDKYCYLSLSSRRRRLQTICDSIDHCFTQTRCIFVLTGDICHGSVTFWLLT